MAVETRVSNETFERLALATSDVKWELWDGVPREKPGMTAAHNHTAFELGYMLRSQLDPTMYEVRVNAGHVRRPESTYFIPDVSVVPTACFASLFELRTLEVYDQRLPLVVEVWSPTTGHYDLTEKLATYQRRGDDDIWFLHPYERTLLARRRLPDGAYEEFTFTEGAVRPIALAGVEIDLATLFRL